MNNYLFIILDRYESSCSKVIPFRSNMKPIQAFRFAYFENVEDNEEFYEDEIAINLCSGKQLTTYDGEHTSYILIQH